MLHSEEKRNFGNIVPEYDVRPFVQDQAEGLRQLVRQRGKAARTLAVTSGKGGVGKTNVSVNMALALAHAGHRTLLIDLDLGLANADILLNVNPRFNLSQVVSGKKEISEVTMPVANRLDLIAGASGVGRLADLADGERERLIFSFERLQHAYEFILFDTGAGISKNTVAFLAASDEILLVTVPEPPAIVDAYAVLKMLTAQHRLGDVNLIVNMVRDRAEAEKIASGFASVANKFLNVYVENIGFILYDTMVNTAVRRKVPFVTAFPQAAASQCLRQVMTRIVTPRRSEEIVPERPGFIRRLLHAIVGT